jgi:hypothetical protein
VVARKVFQLTANPGSAASHPFDDHALGTVLGRADQHAPIRINLEPQRRAWSST